MSKITVTRLQRANALDALHNMWPSVPPKNVIKRLSWWTQFPSKAQADCGTVACFGGWCAHWPNFKAQGVSVGVNGAPVMQNINNVSEKLFGNRILFMQRLISEEIGKLATLTDHELVSHRLRELIKNSTVRG